MGITELFSGRENAPGMGKVSDLVTAIPQRKYKLRDLQKSVGSEATSSWKEDVLPEDTLGSTI